MYKWKIVYIGAERGREERRLTYPVRPIPALSPEAKTVRGSMVGFIHMREKPNTPSNIHICTL